jgi:chromosome segregation ATPase
MRIPATAAQRSFGGSPRHASATGSDPATAQQCRKICRLIQAAGGVIRFCIDADRDSDDAPTTEATSSLSSELISCTELVFKIPVQDMVCCPIFDENGDISGALHVINKQRQTPPLGSASANGVARHSGFKRSDEHVLHRMCILFGHSLSHMGALRRHKLQFESTKTQFAQEQAQLQAELADEREHVASCTKDLRVVQAALANCRQDRDALRVEMESRVQELESGTSLSLANLKQQAKEEGANLNAEKIQLLQEIEALSADKHGLTVQLQKLLKGNKTFAKAVQDLEAKRADQEKQANLSLATLRKDSSEEKQQLLSDIKEISAAKQSLSDQLQKTLKSNKSLTKALEGLQGLNTEIGAKASQQKKNLRKHELEKVQLSEAIKNSERTAAHELLMLRDRIDQLEKERTEYKDGLEKMTWQLTSCEQMKFNLERELGTLKREHSKQTVALMEAIKSAQNDSPEIRRLKDKVEDASKMAHSMKASQDVLLNQQREEVRQIKTVADRLKSENESIKTQHRHMNNSLRRIASTEAMAALGSFNK